MDYVGLRTAFSKFVGKERFNEFVKTLNTAHIDLKRLRFWQEQLWKRFVQSHPDWPVNFGIVREAFRFCEVHGCDLLRGTVLAPSGQIQQMETQSGDSGRRGCLIGNQDFPYCGWSVNPDDWVGCGTRTMEIWFCPTCRELRAIWESERDPERPFA